MPTPTQQQQQQQQPDAKQQWAARRLLSRLQGLQQRGPVPLPLIFMALGMASMGGWAWATPALLCAGIQWCRPRPTTPGAHH
jgi:hypothetical protein